MNVRERLEAFWLGEKPDRIPYTIYQNEWRHTRENPAWIPMFEAGLGVTYHIGVVKEEKRNVHFKTDTCRGSGHVYTRQTMSTPVGDIYILSEDGWTKKYWLESPDDYRVMIHIAQNTELKPDYEQFLRIEKDYPYYAVPLVFAGRTPIQTILVDYTGLENFSYHLCDCEEVGNSFPKVC